MKHGPFQVPSVALVSNLSAENDVNCLLLTSDCQRVLSAVQFFDPTRFEFELTKSGSERDRVVNSETPVNQRRREFQREIPRCGRDLEGSFRAPVGLSRNGESRRATRSDANRCVKGGNAKTPGGEPGMVKRR